MKKPFSLAASRLLLLPLLLTAFCTYSPVSDSGGGLDIGNPTKIAIVDPVGRPVAHASVKCIPADNWLSNTFEGRDVFSDSGTADTNGLVTLEQPADGSFNLQIDHPSGGALIRNFRHDNTGEVTTVTIRQYGCITGSVTGSSGTPVRINLSGTACNGLVSPDGSYTLSSVPEGWCQPLIMADDYRWSIAGRVPVISATQSLSSPTVSFSTLLLDDFEDSTTSKRLGTIIKKSYWYEVHHEMTGVSVDFSIVPESEGYGSVLHSTMLTAGAWALVGCYIGTKAVNDSAWDFHSAQGCSFDARGSGTLNISFECDTLDRLNYVKQYSSDITLTPQWRHYYIPFDSLTFMDDDNPAPDISWDAASRSVNRIEFNALIVDTAEFWLDNLAIEGVDLSTAY